MLTTQSNFLDFEVGSASDATRWINVFPGAVELDSTVMLFRGGQIELKDLAQFSDASSYQYSVLGLSHHSGQATDLTRAVSTDALSIRELSFPTIPSGFKPLGLFTLYSSDKIAVELVSWCRVS